jgi:CDP-diglyceride synthetase
MIYRNKIIVWCIAAIVLFFPVAYFMPRMLVFDAVNAVGIVIGIYVLWAYFPGAVKAINGDKLERVHFLVLGIIATWIAMIARTVYLWTWRYMGEPEGGLDHLSVAFIAFLIVVGGVFHLLAPRVLDGNVPRTSLSHLMWAISLGACLAFGIWLLRWSDFGYG